MANENELAVASRAGTIRLEVVTPEGAAIRVDVDQVEAPSVNGEFGVLPGHLPLLAAMRPGVVRYRSAGKTLAAAVGAGFAEAGPDRMAILTDRCVDGKDVDVADVRAQLESASRKVDAWGDAAEGPAFEELSRAVQWYQAQLDAARELGRV
ncbi:MAG: ATP synthase F1 subunit epsilon [Polyangiales bacterium]